MKVAFIVLCHGPVDGVLELLNLPYFRNDAIKLYVHYDRKSGAKNADRLRKETTSLKNVVVLDQQINCRWGEYSLVEATLLGLEAAVNDSEFVPEFCYLISGSCFPIKPFEALQSYLLANLNKDFIEAVDPQVKQWSVGGYETERLRLYYPFNFQTQRSLFEASGAIQRFLRISRRLPPAINIRFGAQWFCLRRETARLTVAYLRKKGVRRFFKASWIPDESAIQSTVATVRFQHENAGFSLTYYEFNSAGRPITFYDDHVDHLAKQPHFFARKRSHDAQRLIEAFSLRTAKDNGERIRPDRILKPTGQFRLHQKVFASASAIGNRPEEPFNPLIQNRNDYWVVTGTSPAFVRAVLRKVRKWELHCPYDYLFDKDRLVPAHERLELEYLTGKDSALSAHELSKFNGYSQEDTARRNYSPLSFLFEVLQNQDSQVIFALDPTDMPLIVDHIRRDRHAHLIAVDPPFDNLTEKRIFRLTDEEAEGFQDLRGTMLRDAIFSHFEKGHTELLTAWSQLPAVVENKKGEKVPPPPTLCSMTPLAESTGGIADCLKSAVQEINLEDVFSESHLKLISNLNPG